MVAISPNVSSGPYTADGIQTEFPFAFSIATSDEILVEVNDSPVSDALYTVSFSDVSGTVTFLNPPANGVQIRLLSDPDYLQASAFADQGAYNLSTVNLINRRAAIRELVSASKVARALKVPIGEVAPALGSLAGGEGKVLGIVGGLVVPIPNDIVGAEAAAAAARADPGC